MAFVPSRGDYIWIDLNPKLGREQAKRRPLLVLTPKSYNSKTGMLVGLPITSKVKGFPFECSLPSGEAVSGAVLVNQVRSLDWTARNATKIGEASNDVRYLALDLLASLVGFDDE